MMLALSLIEHPGLRLTAIAPFIPVVRAVIDGVDAAANTFDFLPQPCMDVREVLLRHRAAGDTSLIGDEDDAIAGAFELGDRLLGARFPAKFPPILHVIG